MSVQDEIEKIDAEIGEKTEMIDRFAQEIKEIEVRRVILDAELAGLREKRRVLSEAVPTSQAQSANGAQSRRPSEVEFARMTLVDAVTYVVNAASEPLSIDDVRERLADLGRQDVAGSVSMTLSYAAQNGRIGKVSRGLYRGL